MNTKEFIKYLESVREKEGDYKICVRYYMPEERYYDISISGIAASDEKTCIVINKDNILENLEDGKTTISGLIKLLTDALEAKGNGEVLAMFIDDMKDPIKYSILPIPAILNIEDINHTFIIVCESAEAHKDFIEQMRKEFKITRKDLVNFL
jgi:hypothetical protein